MKLLDKLFGKGKKEVTTEKFDEDRQIIANSILFDGEWYCKEYGFGKYLDAASHYLKIGWIEGKKSVKILFNAGISGKKSGRSRNESVIAL